MATRTTLLRDVLGGKSSKAVEKALGYGTVGELIPEPEVPGFIVGDGAVSPLFTSNLISTRRFCSRLMSEGAHGER